MRPGLKNALIIGVVALATGSMGYWLARRAHSLNPPDVKGFHEDRLEKVPDGAFLVVSFDAGWLLEVIIEKNLGMGSSSNADETTEALSEASEEYFGIDIMEARRGLLWAIMDKKKGDMAGVFIEGDFDGELSGAREEEQGDYELVQLHSGVWAALVDGGLVLGTKAAVELGLDVESEEEDGLGSKAIERHQKVLDSVGDGPLVVSLDYKELKGLEVPMLRGLKSLAVAYEADGSITAALHGKKRALSKLMEGWEEAQDQATEALENVIDDADESRKGARVPGRRVVTLLAATFALHKLDDVFAAANLEHDDDLLTARLEGQAGFFMMMAGWMTARAAVSFARPFSDRKERSMVRPATAPRPNRK